MAGSGPAAGVAVPSSSACGGSSWLGLPSAWGAGIELASDWGLIGHLLYLLTYMIYLLHLLHPSLVL